ncbi:hypothetical protein MMC13_003716 [Lambiella insularis]|nr:hypothetical protein [Lambiella insularis]
MPSPTAPPSTPAIPPIGPSPLPAPHYTIPYWRTELHPLDAHRSTPSLPEKCEVLIVGAGMAGVSVAYHLMDGGAEKGERPEVVMLEAREVCSGATGRNGGHLMHPPLLSSRLTSRLKLSSADAAEVTAFVDAQIPALKRVVEKEGIECEFQTTRNVHVWLDEEEAEDVKRKLKNEERSDLWVLEGELEELERLTGVKGARAAASVPAAHLWPYKFVTSLVQIAVDRGLNLQTNTPVSSITTVSSPSSSDSNGTYHSVHTPRGTILAHKVIIATNGYTSAILPQYAGKIIPWRGMCSHVAVPEKTPPLHPKLTRTFNIHYGGNAADYVNPRPDGGVVIGGGQQTYLQERELYINVADDSSFMGKEKYFDGVMQRNFSGWEDSGAFIENVWTGIMGCTPDLRPHIGKVPGQTRIWMLAGFNGGGMTMIFLAADGIAKMVRDDIKYEESGIPKAFHTSQQRLDSKSNLLF